MYVYLCCDYYQTTMDTATASRNICDGLFQRIAGLLHNSDDSGGLGN
jgi:hypothetical protein